MRDDIGTVTEVGLVGVPLNKEGKSRILERDDECKLTVKVGIN